MKVNEVSVEIAPTSSYKKYCVVVKVGRKRYDFVHLNKPKVISGKSFDEAMEVIEITLPDGFEFELEPGEVEGKAPVKVARK